jgi:hypothetical protein
VPVVVTSFSADAEAMVAELQIMSEAAEPDKD